MRLLVSVRSAAEAAAALRGGAAIVDIKEPRHGSLGAADPQVWQAVLQEVAGRAPVSAALGELAEPDLVGRLPRTHGLQFVKIGLAGMQGRDWRRLWREAIEQTPSSVAQVAVCYADARQANAPPWQEVLEEAAQNGCRAVLVDTFDKAGGDLFDHLPVTELHSIAAVACSARMPFVLAGALGLARLPLVRAVAPDYLAVRGAVCRQGRAGEIDERLVAELASRLQAPIGQNLPTAPDAKKVGDLLDNPAVHSDIDA